MFLLLLGILSIAPGIALLSYFYLRDRYEAEPLRLVLWSFLLGMFSVLPVTLLQHTIGQFVTSRITHIMIVAAGIEEIIKFIILILFIIKNNEVNEIYDGILYAVAISLGFATLENVVSVLPHGLETAAIRAVLPTPGHALFAVIMGYYAGKAKFSSKNLRLELYGKAFFYAWFLHALYDFILAESHYLWGTAILPFMVGLWIVGLRKVKAAQERSPFKPKE